MPAKHSYTRCSKCHKKLAWGRTRLCRECNPKWHRCPECNGWSRTTTYLLCVKCREKHTAKGPKKPGLRNDNGLVAKTITQLECLICGVSVRVPDEDGVILGTSGRALCNACYQKYQRVEITI